MSHRKLKAIARSTDGERFLMVAKDVDPRKEPMTPTVLYDRLRDEASPKMPLQTFFKFGNYEAFEGTFEDVLAA